MMRWLRSLLGGGGRLRARDIKGCVLVGGNSGIVYQIYNGGEPPEPPSLPWDDGLPAPGPFDTFNLLRWTSRLSPELIGREREKQDLLDWAAGGRDLRIRLLTGPGGAGKTRLAAELAQSLRDLGWHAGFASLRDSVPRPISDKGLLLIVDYPEEWRQQIRVLLQRAAGREPPPAAIRVLLLSRQPMDYWREDIEQAGASSRCDSYEVTIGPLEMQASVRLFRAVAERLAADRKIDLPALSDSAIEAWIGRDPPLHRLPLYTTAAAIHAVIEPAETLSLTGAQIIEALVERERRRLDAAGRSAGWGEHAVSRLAGLAALRAGLDAAALRRLAAPALEIGLPWPEQVVDAARSLGWWKNSGLPAPSPDLIAAELLSRVLQDRPDLAPEWIWQTLNDPSALEVRRLDRLAHDIVTLHGPEDHVLGENLVRAVSNDLVRAGMWRAFLDSEELGFRLSPVGIAIAKTLLGQPQLAQENRAVILNNLSLRLNAAGDRLGALTSMREAVEIRRPLALDNPTRFAPDLSSSLGNLSACLAQAGDVPAALIAIREAADTYRRLAQDNRAQFAPDLAGSLNNLSVTLRVAGDSDGALAAIREAVAMYRDLAQYDRARFISDVALSLNNLSLCLAGVGNSAGALSAIREAVDVRRQLAQENPARFDLDLAVSLKDLWDSLSNANDGDDALAAIREAVTIYRRLPVRFAPDLARSLDNLSLRLAEANDAAGALAAN